MPCARQANTKIGTLVSSNYLLRVAHYLTFSIKHDCIAFDTRNTVLVSIFSKKYAKMAVIEPRDRLDESSFGRTSLFIDVTVPRSRSPIGELKTSSRTFYRALDNGNIIRMLP